MIILKTLAVSWKDTNLMTLTPLHLTLGKVNIFVCGNVVVTQIPTLENFHTIMLSILYGKKICLLAIIWAKYYLYTFWIFLFCAMQKHLSLIGQVHVDAVCSQVIGHRQFIVTMIAHLLHDLQTRTHKYRMWTWTSRNSGKCESIRIAGIQTVAAKLLRCLWAKRRVANGEHRSRHSFSADVILFM